MKKVINILLIVFLFNGKLFSQIIGGDIYYNSTDQYGVYDIDISLYFYGTSSYDSIQIFGIYNTSYLHKAEEIILPDNCMKYLYSGSYVHAGPEVIFEVYAEIPNWVDSVINIPNSGDEAFSLKTRINSSIPSIDNSPVLLYPPIDKAIQGSYYTYNPGAYDPDGDSIVYEIVSCIGNNVEEIPNYELPPASNIFFFDSISGDIIWDSPIDTGLYAFALKIEEWREGEKIGYIFRQMTIIVESSSSIEDIHSNNKITLFPNPSNNIINIKIDNPITGLIIIQILDALGNIIYTNEYRSFINKTIDLSGLRSGLYLIKIQHKNSVIIEKFIKE